MPFNHSFFYQHRDVISVYFSQTQNATFDYYKPIVEGCKKVLVVDLGWNGTCGIALKYLLEEKKKLDITVCSALVGAKDGQEPTVRMTNGDLFVYGFARNMNYDLQKNHMGKDVDYHNLLMEILFTAPEPSFLKFGYMNETNIEFVYRDMEIINIDQIKKTHKGIREFAMLWEKQCLFIGNFESHDALWPIQRNWRNNTTYSLLLQQSHIDKLSTISE